MKNKLINTNFSMTQNNEVFHVKEFIPKDSANEYIGIIESEIVWTRFKSSPKSRLVSTWCPGGDRMVDLIIEQFVNKIQINYNTKIMGVFLNLYKNGDDYCSYHRDQYNTDVFTISIGESRDLLLKPDDKTKTSTIKLDSGDLYFMSQLFQTKNKHSIPKRKKITGKRISVVFFGRTIV